MVEPKAFLAISFVSVHWHVITVQMAQDEVWTLQAMTDSRPRYY